MAQDWDLPGASDSLSASREMLIEALSALLSCFSGASEPDASIRVAGMLWWDTSTSKLKIRNTADSAWLEVAFAGGSGEANTASNGGAGGVGVWDSKAGVDLIFRNLIAGDGTINVALDAGNKEIEIKVPIGGITSAELADQSVGLAEMVHVPQYSILIRTTAGTGAWETTVVAANVASILQAADYAAIRTLLSLGALALKTTIATADIDAGAVDAAAIGIGAVGSSELADGAVDTAAIQDDAVTFAKLQNASAGNKVIGAATAGNFTELPFNVPIQSMADDVSLAAIRTTLNVQRLIFTPHFTFVFASAGAYTTEKRVYFRCPVNMTAVDCYLLSGLATSGSTASIYWESYARNMTQSEDLCSAKKTTNGAEIADGVAWDLVLDQNLTLILAGDIIALTVRSLGAATSMSGVTWSWIFLGTIVD